MAQITLKHVSKTYDNGVKALQNIDFTVTDHDFLVLLGPSGCALWQAWKLLRKVRCFLTIRM